MTKFLKSVSWRDPAEVKQAVEVLLPVWTDIDMDDVLELLGPGTVDSHVRAFAVCQLARADDDVRISTSCSSHLLMLDYFTGTRTLPPSAHPGPQI